MEQRKPVVVLDNSSGRALPLSFECGGGRKLKISVYPFFATWMIAILS
jgi:hypothetical protein